MSTPALRVPNVSCPVCRTSPAVRVSAVQVELAQGRPPEEPLVSVQCQACIRRRRVVVYWLTAGQVAGAYPGNGNGRRST